MANERSPGRALLSLQPTPIWPHPLITSTGLKKEKKKKKNVEKGEKSLRFYNYSSAGVSSRAAMSG